MKYRCTVCGFVYEPGTPFADLQDSWVCPVCGVGKSKFEPVKEEIVVRRYSNGEITVVWQPHLCDHNGNCWKKLPEVFNPRKRPWVYIHGADSPTITKIVEECPTKALTWEKARPDDQVRPK